MWWQITAYLILVSDFIYLVLHKGGLWKMSSQHRAHNISANTCPYYYTLHTNMYARSMQNVHATDGQTREGHTHTQIHIYNPKTSYIHTLNHPITPTIHPLRLSSSPTLILLEPLYIYKPLSYSPTTPSAFFCLFTLTLLIQEHHKSILPPHHNPSSASSQ